LKVAVDDEPKAAAEQAREPRRSQRYYLALLLTLIGIMVALLSMPEFRRRWGLERGAETIEAGGETPARPAMGKDQYVLFMNRRGDRIVIRHIKPRQMPREHVPGQVATQSEAHPPRGLSPTKELARDRAGYEDTVLEAGDSACLPAPDHGGWEVWAEPSLGEAGQRTGGTVTRTLDTVRPGQVVSVGGGASDDPTVDIRARNASEVCPTRP
jgi:hypothetical protein